MAKTATKPEAVRSALVAQQASMKTTMASWGISNGPEKIRAALL